MIWLRARSVVGSCDPMTAYPCFDPSSPTLRGMAFWIEKSACLTSSHSQ